MPQLRGQDIRDAIVFGVGIAGIAYETFHEKADRPVLIVLFAAMIGLPPFLRGDESEGFTTWIVRPWTRRNSKGEGADDRADL